VRGTLLALISLACYDPLSRECVMKLINIAWARAADHEWCARLMASSEPWITLRRDLDACRAVLVRTGAELFIACDAETGDPLGFILLSPYGFATSPYVASIAVAPEARGVHIGSQLMVFAERHFRDRRHLFLLVSSFNSDAQKFYVQHGYEFVGELKDYIVSGHSELIFHKRLQ